ncbi:MAG: glutathione binding-like protein [Pseudomonadota bacterium]
MADLSSFDITKRWPAQNPDVIQLYSLPTPNGVKASIMLEETGLDYEPHKVSFATDDQMTPEFISLNPNNKIPAMIDPNGPNGGPIGIWESGAILIYLAEKAGMLLPTDPAKRMETLQWLMFQMGGVGPMFGQFGHFYKFAADKISDPYPTDRYLGETKRLLGVLDKRLADHDYVAGDYSIADIAIFPWLNTIVSFYEAGDVTGFDDHENVRAYLDRCLERPAVQRGAKIPA